MKVQRKWIEIDLPDEATFEFNGADVIVSPFKESQCSLKIMSIKSQCGSAMKVNDIKKYIKEVINIYINN